MPQTFSIAGPTIQDPTLAFQGDCRQDSFDFRGTSGDNLPIICGENAGQHMYADVGFDGFDSFRIIQSFSGAFNRIWRIKVSQFTCGSIEAPPPGCMNYLTGITGQVRSFNFVRTDGPANVSE